MLKLISNLFNKKEDNIKEYYRLHEENISLCDEMLSILKGLDGDKE